MPLPQAVRKQPKKTYANSSKAKPRQPSNTKRELIQLQDPRIAKKKLLVNIPLSTRKEVESNSDYVQWLNKVAVPECRELISNSESLLKEINKERHGITATLDRIRIEQGESELRTACYNYCNQRM